VWGTLHHLLFRIRHWIVNIKPISISVRRWLLSWGDAEE